MSIMCAFSHTCALPASWLSLRDLLLLRSASPAMRDLLVSYPEPWRTVADLLRAGQPRAWQSQQCALAGIERRRNASGAMIRLTLAERRRLHGLPLPALVVAHAASVNAPMAAHERAFRFDAVGKVSSYPPSLCRSCSRFARDIVWGGRCSPCFRRDDVEVSAGECTALGLRASHRRGLPYRAVYQGGVLSKRYSLRELHAGLPLVRSSPAALGSRRSATVLAARRHSFTSFRRYVQSCGVDVA